MEIPALKGNASPFLHDVKELGELAVHRHQFPVSTLFHQLAILQHDYLIGDSET